jgi:excisionase family DNA binding protein
MNPVVNGGAPRLRGETRLALSIDDAARVLSVSRDSFERHVMSEIRVVRVGRRLLVPVRELEAWVERSSAMPLVGEISHLRKAARPMERRVAR